MKNRIISVNGAEVAIATRNEQDYISLTDMVKRLGYESVLYSLMRDRETIEFLGIRSKFTTRISNLSNSRELEMRLGEAASFCRSRSGLRPALPSAQYGNVDELSKIFLTKQVVTCTSRRLHSKIFEALKP
ncbi:MAG: hypothetical protein U5M53_02495 [Rhodoferax sp.]|nr:hypothetical protein [Rhodoferax sp.]